MSGALDINVNADSDLVNREVFLERNFRIIRDLLTPEAWHIVGAAGEPAFQNGWVNYDLATEPGAAFYHFLDKCSIRGVIKDGTSGAVAFTLPASHRPDANIHFPALAIKGTLKLAHIEIKTNGDVIPILPTGATDILFPEILFRLADT